MTDLTQIAQEMGEIKATIKQLNERYEGLADQMSNAINIGMADPFGSEADGYQFNDVRLKLVTTSRWKYGKDTTAKIAEIKAQAELEGDATKTETVSLRLTQS